ncbi:hypothetical protein HS121_17785 [bacterium]|nr:hypothetical protein [bacterium]
MDSAIGKHHTAIAADLFHFCSCDAQRGGLQIIERFLESEQDFLFQEVKVILIGLTFEDVEV